MSDDTSQTEQLRGIVGTVLSPDLRDSFVEYAHLDAFRGEDGEIDTEKVMGHLTAIHVATQQQSTPQTPNWGQHSSSGLPAQERGADGRAALEKRHGIQRAADRPRFDAARQRGENGRAALQRRHGVDKR